MTSTILQAAEAFTDTTIAKLTRSPLINDGSLFLFDFTDDYCNPNADGPLKAGDAFKNMVGGADGLLTSTVSGAANAAGKTGITAVGGYSASNPSQIKLGGPVATLGKAFVSIFWIRQTGIVPSPNENQVMFGDRQKATPNNIAWAVLAGLSGKVPLAQQRAASPARNVQTNGVVDGYGFDKITQYAVSWTPGANSSADGTLTFYADGAVVGSSTASFSGDALVVTGEAPHINLFVPGKYYLAYMERLDLSGRTALQAVQADYELNKTRFS